MTQLQTRTMTGLAAVALGISALLATGALTSAQTDEPTATPAATEDAGDTPEATDDAESADDTDDAQSGDTEDEDGRGCGGGGKYLIKEAAAEVLGLSEDELIAALMDGQTLAEIAEAQGMSVDDFSAALVTAVTADLQAQLDDGDITQEEFDEITADLEARIDEIINAEGGLRFHHRFDGDGTEEGTEGTGARFRAPFQTAPFGSGT